MVLALSVVLLPTRIVESAGIPLRSGRRSMRGGASAFGIRGLCDDSFYMMSTVGRLSQCTITPIAWYRYDRFDIRL